jgi:hypothetical protein
MFLFFIFIHIKVKLNFISYLNTMWTSPKCSLSVFLSFFLSFCLNIFVNVSKVCLRFFIKQMELLFHYENFRSRIKVFAQTSQKKTLPGISQRNFNTPKFKNVFKLKKNKKPREHFWGFAFRLEGAVLKHKVAKAIAKNKAIFLEVVIHFFWRNLTES